MCHSRVRPLRVLAIALCLTAGTADREAWGGAYVFAGEQNSVDIVTHPPGYAGSGGTVSVEVCIDPTSANATSMEVAVQNAVNTVVRLEPDTGNLVSGSSNEIAANQVDFESTVLHELGHCLGLAHTNLGSESGLTGADTEYTRSSDGPGSSYGLDPGADGVRGSSDDARGNDRNLFYFRIADNDPFAMEASVFDATTYSRDLGDLPMGHSFAANGERSVASLLGVAGATEAVMQQGAFFDEEQRVLTHDDVATLRFAMSGVDEVQGTSDDYSLGVSYVGLTASCDVILTFDDGQTPFASCHAGGTYIDFPHASITTASIYFNSGYNWFFTSIPVHCGNGELDGGEECDDGGLVAGDCCSATCAFESQGSACDDSDACTDFDSCDAAGSCVSGAALDCDDGAWCNGTESCDSQLGCQSGSPVVVDDGVACTDDSCDVALDTVVNAPNHLSCADGLWCTGTETCDALLGCQPGTPVTVDDGVACTDDSCDDDLDAVLNVPNDGNCDDSLWCSGTETCDALLGCQSGSPVAVDDGVACTLDSCDDELNAVVNAPDDAFCDDGDWCNGPETCGVVAGCEPGNPVALDACVAVPATSHWGLGVLAVALLVAGAGLAAGRLRHPSA